MSEAYQQYVDGGYSGYDPSYNNGGGNYYNGGGDLGIYQQPTETARADDTSNASMQGTSRTGDVSRGVTNPGTSIAASAKSILDLDLQSILDLVSRGGVAKPSSITIAPTESVSQGTPFSFLQIALFIAIAIGGLYVVNKYGR